MHLRLCEQAVANLIYRWRYQFRFAKRFFPRPDPRFIELARFITRIVEENGSLLRGGDAGAKQRPERPVGAVKSGHENISKDRRTRTDLVKRSPISSVNQFESAICELPLESCFDVAQRWKFHCGKVPSGGAESIDCAEQMIRCARHGFCSEKGGLQHSLFSQRGIFRELHAFLRSNGKEKTQMLAQRKAHSVFREQQFPQFRRRNEVDAEKRQTAIEQQPLDRVSVTTKRYHHQSGLLLLPRDGRGTLEPG